MISRKQIIACLMGIFALSSSAAAETSIPAADVQEPWLHKQPGFFRFSYDQVKMPQQIKSMGLLGVNYFADITPHIYAGMGTYASVTGKQGGLFTLGVGAGIHHEFARHWWGDIGIYVGGGGGRSSLVGGGLMLRPHIGIAYDWKKLRTGLHYSYIDFPDGQIRSDQIGVTIDIPWDFYYLLPQKNEYSSLDRDHLHYPQGKHLAFQRNDFALLVQAYRQHPGTRNVNGAVQDDTIGLLGAELNHYMTDRVFGWVRTSGAFCGNPNGYMDLLGGLGYRWPLGSGGVALVPMLGAGAGGGGNVDTGGGILLQAQVGVEIPLTSSYAARLSGGYLWAPDGELRAFTATGELLYHLNIATLADKPTDLPVDPYESWNWRVHLLNQTYLRPQRAANSVTSPINLVAVQFDQMLTPAFFLCYQAASAYSGKGAGGLATGKIGLGVQHTINFLNQHLQPFAEVFLGAGGGGGLALGAVRWWRPSSAFIMRLPRPSALSQVSVN